MFRILQFFVGIYLKLFYPTKVKGKENLPKGAAIISSNHTSNYDALLLACNTWEKKRYLAKKELFKSPIMRVLMKWAGAIKIDRSTSDVTAVKNCLKVLKDGKKLVIFPEGTRNKSEDMELGEVKHGVSMFAIKAKVPVVPMYINRKPKFMHRTIITFGQPFELEELYGKRLDGEALEQASGIVAEKMKLLQDECITKYAKKKKVKEKKAA